MRWSKVAGSPWIVRQRTVERPRLRLICFPYAGGGASAFTGWADAMGEDVEVLLVQPPGREWRLMEPPFRRLEPMVAAMRSAIDPVLDVPHSFFGHSMGAFVAFELYRARRRDGQALPRHLFVSASRAPHVPDDEAPIHALPDAEFIERIRARYDGIPAEVLANADLLRLLLPTLKADLELVESYSPVLEPRPIRTPVVAFAGSDDRAAPASYLSRWRELTSESFRLHTIEGNHFFVTSNRELVLETVADEL